MKNLVCLHHKYFSAPMTRAKHDHSLLEEGSELLLDFHKLSTVADLPVVPVVVQDAESLEVLILAFANEEALRRSLQIGQAVFYSTSRKEIWHKGATSGDFLNLVEVRVNCEQNSLLYLVKPLTRGSCHTKMEDGSSRPTCYYRTVKQDGTLAFRRDMR